jgi:hypothetical protein
MTTWEGFLRAARIARRDSLAARLICRPEILQTQVSETRPFGELRAGCGIPDVVEGM